MNETAVLISIKPKWASLILSGKKTIEIRKTVPKLAPPLTCYIYESGTGCVVGEFVCDEIDFGYEWYGEFVSLITGLHSPGFYEKSRIDASTIWKYSKNKCFYTWHISSVMEYDEPLPLSDFCGLDGTPIKRPPQSWRYVKKAVRIIHADISQVSSGTGRVDVALRQTPDGKAEMRVLNAIAETEDT